MIRPSRAGEPPPPHTLETGWRLGLIRDWFSGASTLDTQASLPPGLSALLCEGPGYMNAGPQRYFCSPLSSFAEIYFALDPLAAR